MLSINLDQNSYHLAHSKLMRDLDAPFNSDILNKFSSTSLAELNELGLDNRVDSKFVIPLVMLDDVIKHLSHDYSILTIDNENIFTYENTYFDTSDRFFYQSHHNGKLNRHKLRFRRYKESDLCVLETKFKTNKSRTVKHRIPIKQDDQQNIVDFVNEQVNSATGNLSPKLFNNYRRMTFTHLHKKEKITLDFDLGFENPDNNMKYHIDDYFVVEVKANDKVHRSEFSLYCKKNGIRENRFSKYCMGICLTNANELKTNNFKKKLSLFR